MQNKVSFNSNNNDAGLPWQLLIFYTVHPSKVLGSVEADYYKNQLIGKPFLQHSCKEDNYNLRGNARLFLLTWWLCGFLKVTHRKGIWPKKMTQFVICCINLLKGGETLLPIFLPFFVPFLFSFFFHLSTYISSVCVCLFYSLAEAKGNLLFWKSNTCLLLNWHPTWQS